MRGSLKVVSVVALLSVGCVDATSPARPAPRIVAAAGSAIALAANASHGPGYEPAYYNNTTVTINAIEVPQHENVLNHVTAEFYQVVYPTDHSLWPSQPQCAPCDHAGDGIDFTDFHDHLLDSVPSSPGHGEFSPLWHVLLIIPVAGKEAQYAALLPMKSEAAVDAAIAAGLALEIDTHFYFLCSVVSAHAAH